MVTVYTESIPAVAKTLLSRVFPSENLMEAGKKIYNRRSQIVEPPFGQIKHDRGFTRFLRIGQAKVLVDWLQVCTVHNLLKLFRSGLW